MKHSQWVRSFFAFTAAFFLLLASVHGAESWNPSKTRALILGVLVWDDPALATWPDKGRSDAVLVEVLKSRSVKAEKITYLQNKAATRSASLAALDQCLAASEADETFLFYYCGHGGRDKGTTVLYPYDCKKGGTLDVKTLAERIAQHFKGNRVLLLADCCYSGGLNEAAAILQKSGKAALVMASVVSSSTSTGAWTFTDSLIDVFSGKISGGSSGISIADASGYLLENMRNADAQLANIEKNDSFPADFVLAVSTPPLVPARPLFREAKSEGKWYPVRILQKTETGFRIHYLGYGDDTDEVVGPERLRLPKFESFSSG
ncbi:MAG: caspase family protein, partial [Spirochaetia bacterium]|nr:caspase family protein [Spirochaetia bacterium]